MARTTSTGRRSRRAAGETAGEGPADPDDAGPVAGQDTPEGGLPDARPDAQDAQVAQVEGGRSADPTLPAEGVAYEGRSDRDAHDTVPDTANDTVPDTANDITTDTANNKTSDATTETTTKTTTESPTDTLPQGPVSSAADDAIPQPSPEEPTVPHPQAAPDAVATAIPAPLPAPRRGGVVGPVIGGIVAAGIGAAAVLYLLPQGWQPADTSALQARVATLEQRGAAVADLGDLPDRVAALEGSALEGSAQGGATDLAPLTDRIAALEAALSEGAADADAGLDLSPLLERIAALEALEPAPPAPDLGPLSDRIEALEGSLPALVAAATADIRAELVGQAQTIAATAEDLAAAQNRAEARALLGELGLAADTGAPVPDALDRLAATQDLPPGLDAFRAGLPTLAALQGAFPAVARAALAAAPPPPDAGAGDRLMTFLRSQTGARSLAPRDGMDTDAILSRAEAAVRRADLTAALAELDTLPPDPAAAAADWRALAEARQAALAALADLSARLGQD